MTDPVTPVEAPAVPAQEPASAPVQPDYTQVLQGIKDATGNPKYTSVEAALASVQPSQAHITTIESENKTLREENERIKAEQAAKDSILEEIKRTQQASTVTTEPPTLDVNALDEAVGKQMDARDQRKLLQDRVTEMDRKLTEVYGSKEAAQAAVSKAAAANGLSVQGLLELGATNSPAVVYKLMDIDKPNVTPPRSLSTGDIQTPGHQEPTARKTPSEMRRDFFKDEVDPDLSRAQALRRELEG